MASVVYGVSGRLGTALSFDATNVFLDAASSMCRRSSPLTPVKWAPHVVLSVGSDEASFVVGATNDEPVGLLQRDARPHVGHDVSGLPDHGERRRCRRELVVAFPSCSCQRESVIGADAARKLAAIGGLRRPSSKGKRLTVGGRRPPMTPRAGGRVLAGLREWAVRRHDIGEVE